MENRIQRITPFLWFDDQAEEAATFYTSVFENSRIVDVTRYDREAAATTRRPEGSAMTVSFELAGQSFTALNGGPHYSFTPAVSFVVHCSTQEEIDHYWEKLSQGGDEKALQCGWLKDRFGLSWQVVPKQLFETIGGDDAAGRQRAMAAMMQMTRLDVARLQAAYAG